MNPHEPSGTLFFPNFPPKPLLMESYNTQKNEVLTGYEPEKLPGGLNVLTILTFIGCGLAYIGVLAGLFMSKSPQAQRADLESAADKAGDGFAGKMIQSQLDAMDAHSQYYENMYHYRFLLFGSMLIFTTLCLVGAIQMRKRRKSGFMLYTIGELAPILVTIVLVGAAGDGTWKTYMGYILPVFFVVCYAFQRKHLNRA